MVRHDGPAPSPYTGGDGAGPPEASFPARANLAAIYLLRYHEIMKAGNDKSRGKVAEPVQVYLDPVDRGRLHWLTEQLGTTKSDVLRRALEALERQITDPESHPALRIMKIAEGVAPAPSPDYDVAVEHDRFLADSEEASWKADTRNTASKGRKRSAGRKRG